MKIRRNRTHPINDTQYAMLSRLCIHCTIYVSQYTLQITDKTIRRRLIRELTKVKIIE